MSRLSFLKTQLNAIVLSVGILFASQQSFAYYSPDLAWDLSIGAGYYLLSNEVIEESIKDSKKSNKTTKSATTKPKTTAQTKTAKVYEYQYSSKISTQVTDEMITLIANQLKQQGAYTNQAQKELQQLKNRQLIPQVRQALKSEGYNPNSVATAMAYWIVVNYGIASGSHLSQLKGHELVKQLENGMSTDSSLANKSSGDKQKIADYLYWITSLKIALHAEANRTGNRQAIQNITNEAHQALKEMGLGVNMLKNNSGNVLIR